MSKNDKAIEKVDQELVNQLRESFPFDPSALRIQLPRISMRSQDKMEGTGKSKKVTEAAGTFYTERQGEEVDEETGNKKWVKEELPAGDTFDGVILFQRKQLRMYDEKTELYTSSPVFDSPDEVIPLWCNKSEVARGTMAELKAKYQYKDEDDKVKSKLEDNKILYILMDGEVYQLNLRGSSMYAYMTYARKVVPPTVLTRFSSEAREKGKIEWNQMTFAVHRPLDNKELLEVKEKVDEIRSSIAIEKQSYANTQPKSTVLPSLND